MWDGRAGPGPLTVCTLPFRSALVYSRIQNRVLVRMNLQDSFDREQEFRKWQWAACEMCVGESPDPPPRPAVQRTACGLPIHADTALRDFALAKSHRSFASDPDSKSIFSRLTFGIGAGADMLVLTSCSVALAAVWLRSLYISELPRRLRLPGLQIRRSRGSKSLLD